MSLLKIRDIHFLSQTVLMNKKKYSFLHKVFVMITIDIFGK